MAFVADTTQQMTVTFEDRDQNTSNVTFFVPSAVVAADIQTFATGALPTTLGALSNASIRRVSISRTFSNDSFVVPGEVADIERKGVFVWLASDRSTSKNEIPSIKNELVIDGSNLVNPNAAEVAAFKAMMIDAGLLDVYGLGNYRGVKLIDYKSAPHKIHRKSAKG